MFKHGWRHWWSWRVASFTHSLWRVMTWPCRVGLKDKVTDPQSYWWEIEVGFEGTQAEAEQIFEVIGDHDVVCLGHPQCSRMHMAAMKRVAPYEEWAQGNEEVPDAVGDSEGPSVPS